jgi:hypothetical protein
MPARDKSFFRHGVALARGTLASTSAFGLIGDHSETAVDSSAVALLCCCPTASRCSCPVSAPSPPINLCCSGLVLCAFLLVPSAAASVFSQPVCQISSPSSLPGRPLWSRQLSPSSPPKPLLEPRRPQPVLCRMTSLTRQYTQRSPHLT